MKKLMTRIKAAFAVLTGDEDGISSLILDWINSLLKKLPDPERTKAISEAVAGVAEAIGRISALVGKKGVAEAISATTVAVRAIADAVADSTISVEEGGAIDTAVRAAVAAWKAAR